MDKLLAYTEPILNLRALALQAKSKLEFLPIAKKYYNGIPANELWNTDPYTLPFDNFFTPIEYEAWCFIRIGGLPFFPEYPALNFFIDFADPYRKIGIECDGKDWHNPEKDFIRDAKLIALGWKIFRLSGEQILRRLPGDVQDELDREWDSRCDGGSYDADYYDFRKDYLDREFGYSFRYGCAIIENIAREYYQKSIVLL